MNTENVTRLPVQHLIYVKEYIRTGDKERAYGKAYPNAQPQSRKAAAWRLSRRPEIQKLIEEKRSEAIEKGFAAAEAAATDRIKEELLSLYERRAELARIVRRQARMNKYYKVKDEMKTIVVPVDSPFAILRAIELDTKLEAQCAAIKPAAEKVKDPWEDDEKYNLRIYIDKQAFEGKEDDLTDEEYDYAIKQSLTSKQFIVVGPTLLPKLESLGCWIHRDMETGKYEIHCPADRLIAKEENGETKYYELEEGEDPEKVTSGNIDGTQTVDNQHETQKISMRHSGNQVPDNKSQIINPQSSIPNQQSPLRRYLYPTDRGALQSNEWVDIARVLDDYWEDYLKKQNMDHKRRHDAIARLARSRNQPPEKRRELELETGWEFHPQHKDMVRRIRFDDAIM